MVLLSGILSEWVIPVIFTILLVWFLLGVAVWIISPDFFHKVFFKD